jgi:glycogen synthase
MKILLLGPYPPPHGGISVHVCELRKQLRASGVECQVVNVDPRAPESSEYVGVRSGVSLYHTLLAYARRGWCLHVHINGHNRNSWLIALTAGFASLFGPGTLLTVHSGMAPEYLTSLGRAARALVRLTCSCYQRLIAVSPDIRDAMASLGVRADRVTVVPAFLFSGPMTRSEKLGDLQARRPLLATALFFRPEYGFELLVAAIEQLRVTYPEIACVVMGDGEGRSHAEKLIAQRGLQRSIVLLGNVDHDECLSLISQVDLFVRPTLVDGDANSVREALALGIGVVASDTGHRPPGVVRFRTGDARDLAAKIEQAWLWPQPGGTTEEKPVDAFTTLLGLYQAHDAQDNHGKTPPITRHAHI